MLTTPKIISKIEELIQDMLTEDTELTVESVTERFMEECGEYIDTEDDTLSDLIVDALEDYSIIA